MTIGLLCMFNYGQFIIQGWLAPYNGSLEDKKLTLEALLLKKEAEKKQDTSPAMSRIKSGYAFDAPAADLS